MNAYRPGALHHVVPALLYVLVVFYLGSASTDPLHDVSLAWKDKLFHAIAFAGMQWTLARAMRFFWVERSAASIALRSAAVAALLGGLLEVWQAALPHRSAEWLDWVADSFGAGVAGLLWWLSHRASEDDHPMSGVPDSQ